MPVTCTPYKYNQVVLKKTLSQKREDKIMTTINKLATRLYAVFKNEAKDQDIHLSNYSYNRFKRMIGMGVERMMMANATQNREKIEQAESNIKYLVNTLSNQAKVKGSFPKIGDNTLETVLDEDNTLWPYV